MDILNVLNTILSIAIGLFILVFLVVIHELGHAIAARRNGVIVEEFGIGFPPRAWARKLKNGILFSLNWLPLGGFVKLQGEHDSADKKGDYGAASFWVKTKILLAGVLINWLTAAAILTVLALVGMPKFMPDQFQIQGDTVETSTPVQVATVTKNSPAEKAGLKVGDEITKVADRTIATSDDLIKATEALKGQTVDITYEREDKSATTSASLNSGNNGGYLGVAPSQSTTLRSTWSAPLVGIGTTAQFSWVTLQGLGDTVAKLFTGLISQFNFDQTVRQEGSKEIGQLSNTVAGPIGILGTIFPSAREAGFVSLMMITAIISLTLAIMNVLPIPALDGGRFFLTALFKILKKPLTKEREETINSIGFMVLLGLIVLVTISDVSKLF